jgi:hypothetical protein
MSNVQVFDPALCCSTGVCGVDIDQALVTFAADIDWLKSQGVSVERANLAQQPQAFADQAQVRQLLQEQGAQALPAVLIDGELRSSGRYPSRAELARWAGVSALSTIGVTTAPAVNACCTPAAAVADTAPKCC